MKTLLAALTAVSLFAALGCGKPETAEPTAKADQPPGATSTGGGGGVAPMTSNVGGMTPMSGTENLQGGGGGVGQAAKDQARSAAGTVGGTQTATSEDEGPADEGDTGE